MTRFSPQKIYKHRSYTIQELADLLGTHGKTVSRWIDVGLKIVPGSKKPILIMGDDAKEFIRNRNMKKKIKLKRHQFYCFTCRGPTYAKRGSITLSDDTKKGACRVCNGKIRRKIKPQQKDYQIPSAPVQMSILNTN